MSDAELIVWCEKKVDDAYAHIDALRWWEFSKRRDLRCTIGAAKLLQSEALRREYVRLTDLGYRV